MKTFAFLICLLTLSASCTQNQNADKTTSGSTSGGSSASEMALAYVNTDSLLMYYEYYDELKKDFEAKKNTAQKQLLGRRNTLQDEFMSAQKRVQAGLVSANEQKKMEDDFAAKQQQLMAYEQDVTEGLMAEEKKLNEDLYKAVTTFIKEEFNKDKRYKIVLGITESGSVFYADPALDVTKPVLDGLNKKYRENKK